MKIAIADNNGGKFTNDIKEHWEKMGHEVRFERGASEYLSQWADVYYVDTWDNNIHYLYKLYHGDEGVSRTPDWDNKKKPKIIVRVLDWEVWIGFVRDQRIVDWVDTIVFIAPHIQRRVESEVDLKGKGVLIRPGVNLERFTFKQKKTDGFQIGMALGDMWWPKNHMAGLDIFTTLYMRNNNWRLHIRGQHEGGNDFWREMYEYYLDSRGIRDVVTLYPQVEDMNEWYENIDYLLHPGMKEAFCYAVGEALAKGIKPIVNNFMGSEEIWDQKFIYNTYAHALRMFNQGSLLIKPNRSYRKYIEENYDSVIMVNKLDELL
jgi:hypothetical protein